MAQNTEAVRSRFHKVVQDHLCLLDEEMHKAEKEDKTLHELGADSLDIVEIAMEIEEDFDIEIPDEDWNGDRKLSELFNELLGLL